MPGDRVVNTGNKKHGVFGVITKIIDSDMCEVLWSDGHGYAHTGTIRRDGSVGYTLAVGEKPHRIVRVKISVRVPAEAREN